MPEMLSNMVAALAFALIGIAVFAISFVILDRLTPFELWREICERQNTAVATLIGLVSLGLGIIIAAAIH